MRWSRAIYSNCCCCYTWRFASTCVVFVYHQSAVITAAADSAVYRFAIILTEWCWRCADEWWTTWSEPPSFASFSSKSQYTVSLNTHILKGEAELLFQPTIHEMMMLMIKMMWMQHHHYLTKRRHRKLCINNLITRNLDWIPRSNWICVRRRCCCCIQKLGGCEKRNRILPINLGILI